MEQQPFSEGTGEHKKAQVAFECVVWKKITATLHGNILLLLGLCAI